MTWGVYDVQVHFGESLTLTCQSEVSLAHSERSPF